MTTLDTRSYPAVSIIGASHSYPLPGRRSRTAVDGLTLEVSTGEIFGLLGANGAGKTTTIKMLLGFLLPDSGSVSIFGRSCACHATRRLVGYLPEQPYFHPFLSPVEVLRMHADLLGLPRRQVAADIDLLLEMTNLQHNRRLPLSRLSKGNQQRVGIAQALLGDPPLLILDEPTSGLDPRGRHEMRQMIAAQKASGRTVLVSSHVLSEIEHLCDRVGIISGGRLTACGSPADIRRSDGLMRIETVEVPPDVTEQLERMGCRLEASSGSGSVVACPQDAVYRVLAALEQAGLPLLKVTSGGESLEEAFLRLAS